MRGEREQESCCAAMFFGEDLTGEGAGEELQYMQS